MLAPAEGSHTGNRLDYACAVRTSTLGAVALLSSSLIKYREAQQAQQAQQRPSKAQAGAEKGSQRASHRLSACRVLLTG